jgi:hypothetical protein
MLVTLRPSSPAGCLSWPQPSLPARQQQQAGQWAGRSRAAAADHRHYCHRWCLSASGSQSTGEAWQCSATQWHTVCSDHRTAHGCLQFFQGVHQTRPITVMEGAIWHVVLASAFQPARQQQQAGQSAGRSTAAAADPSLYLLSLRAN